MSFVSEVTKQGNSGFSSFSQEDAQIKAQNLDKKGCTNCIRCGHCSDCTNCSDCYNCDNCHSCEFCRSCSDLTGRKNGSCVWG